MSEIAEKGTDIVKVTATDRDLGLPILTVKISLEFTSCFLTAYLRITLELFQLCAMYLYSNLLIFRPIVRTYFHDSYKTDYGPPPIKNDMQ